MTRYLWPGNVRELQNRVKRGVIMASGSRLTAKDLELDQDQDVASSATSLKQARENVEREMIEQALKRNSGKITSAAADLGISRPTLYELMEKLGIAKKHANTTINEHRNPPQHAHKNLVQNRNAYSGHSPRYRLLQGSQKSAPLG